MERARDGNEMEGGEEKEGKMEREGEGNGICRESLRYWL